MAQNKNTPIIAMAFFGVLSVMLAVFWYLTWSDNTLKTAALVNAANKEQDLNKAVQDQLAQINTLKAKIGAEEAQEVGHNDATDATVAGEIAKLLAGLGGDGTAAPANLKDAVRSTASESHKNLWTADDRQRLSNTQANNYQQALAAKDQQIKDFQQASQTAQQELIDKETAHSEHVVKLEGQIATLNKDKASLETQLADLRVRSQREKEELELQNSQQREGLVALRRLLRDKEDPTFSRPDGVITSVDHNARRCYLDLGSADGLRTGVTFSVYEQNHSGVGRANTDSIKGKIEVVEVLGPRSAAATIVFQKVGHPVTPNDPVYSPIFQAGQSLEIAVAGQIRIEGLDRGAFRRLVSAAGAKISVEVDDQGQFADGKGEPLTEAEARKRITARTRYLVIGDLGDPSSTTGDIALEALYKEMREKTEVLKAESENLGIYPIGLSSFLEHIGYSRKQIAWTAENGQPFPNRLPNGSRSASARATFGGRESSASISGAFSERKANPLTSGGTTSGAYSK